MKILFAGGGTAGHINPAIAVASYIKQKQPDSQILFCGNPHGMEASLVPKAGFDFTPIKVKGFQRQINLRNIKNNAMAVAYLATASARARQIIKDFSPDIVMGTGGYVSGPVVRKAAQMGIKTVTHEQNAFPGVTTKLLSKYVDKILLAVPEAKKYLGDCDDRCVVTGNPIRGSVLKADRDISRIELGIPDDKVCILSFGGSLGARRINEAIADLMAWHYKRGKIWHIHATGSYGVELFPALLKEKGVDVSGCKNISIREYIDDMPRCLAAADLVISRAGAITLSEIEAAGRASILIPSPNVAENHQYHNAMALYNRNAAVVIEEKDLTGEMLCKQVEELISDPFTLRHLGNNARSMAIIDSNERIYREILKLLKDR